MSDREKKQIENICEGFISLDEQEKLLVSAYANGLKDGYTRSKQSADDRAEP